MADRLEDGEHLGALAHEVVEVVLVVEALPQDARLVDETLLLEHLLEHDLKLLHVDGLAQVVLGSELHGLHGGLHGPVGGHEDDHGLRAGSP